jgi:hypothetical protein|tara:strand:- start:1503 stop:1961 length:459 start_codon:yes stop_codon:yes gene_type:complete
MQEPQDAISSREEWLRDSLMKVMGYCEELAATVSEQQNDIDWLKDVVTRQMAREAQPYKGHPPAELVKFQDYMMAMGNQHDYDCDLALEDQDIKLAQFQFALNLLRRQMGASFVDDRQLTDAGVVEVEDWKPVPNDKPDIPPGWAPDFGDPS